MTDVDPAQPERFDPDAERAFAREATAQTSRLLVAAHERGVTEPEELGNLVAAAMNAGELPPVIAELDRNGAGTVWRFKGEIPQGFLYGDVYKHGADVDMDMHPTNPGFGDRYPNLIVSSVKLPPKRHHAAEPTEVKKALYKEEYWQ